eukprot:g77541.t1
MEARKPCLEAVQRQQNGLVDRERSSHLLLRRTSLAGDTAKSRRALSAAAQEHRVQVKSQRRIELACNRPVQGADVLVVHNCVNPRGQRSLHGIDELQLCLLTLSRRGQRSLHGIDKWIVVAKPILITLIGLTIFACERIPGWLSYGVVALTTSAEEAK